MKMKAIMINAIERIIKVFTVLSSVPKIIGIGPIMINPPPLVFPRKRKPARNIITADMKVSMKPKMIKAKPNAKSHVILTTNDNYESHN